MNNLPALFFVLVSGGGGRIFLFLRCHKGHSTDSIAGLALLKNVIKVDHELKYCTPWAKGNEDAAWSEVAGKAAVRRRRTCALGNNPAGARHTHSLSKRSSELSLTTEVAWRIQWAELRKEEI